MNVVACGVLAPRGWKVENVMVLMVVLFFSMALGGVVHSVWLKPGPADRTGAGEVENAGAPDEGGEGSGAKSSSGRVKALMIPLVAFHGVALIAFPFFLRLHGHTWLTGFGVRVEGLGKGLKTALVTMLAMAPLAALLAGFSGWVLGHFQEEVAMQETVRALQETTGAGEVILMAVAAIVVAPVVEELLFRGIIYPVIKEQGYPRLAWWGTSLFFGLTHGNAATFLSLTLLSMVFIWLYERTGNILVPIAAHCLFNLSNFLIILAAPMID